MSSTDKLPGLFPDPDYDPPPNVVELRNTKSGILPYQSLREMVRAGELRSRDGIAPDQIQPASVDLRLGPRAYRVRASFLPGPNAKVMEKVEQLDGLPAIDLSNDTVLEKGIVYVIELMESVNLAPGSGLEGFGNPKSSTGRLDVLVRLITDEATGFDHVKKGYMGPLFLEVAPLTFSLVVRQGSRLNQIRFHRNGATLSSGEIDKLYKTGQLVKSPSDLLPLRGSLVPVTIDLQGTDGGVVGYKARQNANKIDVDKVGHYDPRDYWDKIEPHDGRLFLHSRDFNILATREEVGVPPNLAAEMVPYHSGSGEFRVHYAGFFDPGFGWNGRCAEGSKAVLEVRSYGVSFTLEHGQIVGWLNYSRLATGLSDKIYGDKIGSHYQGQGVALAKQFKPWPI